jgi:hypothetical protein
MRKFELALHLKSAGIFTEGITALATTSLATARAARSRKAFESLAII